MENNTPKYYSFQTDSGQDFDVFKLVRWIRAKIPDFSFEKSNALKYMLRIKGDNKKLIDDCKKAINCLQKELAELEAKENNDSKNKTDEPIKECDISKSPDFDAAIDNWISKYDKNYK